MTIDLFHGYSSGIHTLDIPTILFSKTVKEPSFEEMLLFFEADAKFKRIRNNTAYWIDFVSGYPISSSPDFSIYWSMSLGLDKKLKRRIQIPFSTSALETPVLMTFALMAFRKILSSWSGRMVA